MTARLVINIVFNSVGGICCGSPSFAQRILHRRRESTMVVFAVIVLDPANPER